MIKRTGFVLMTMVAVALSMSRTAAAAEVSRYTFSGAQASLQFWASTPLICDDGSGGFAFVFGGMQGAEQVSKSAGSSYESNGAVVYVDGFYNSCTGVNLSGASGGISNGFSVADKKLTAASLVGSGTVQEFVYGQQLPVSIDVQFEGIGPTNVTKSNTQSRVIGSKGGPLSINSSHGANSNRQAEASGTITVGGVAFSELNTVFATLYASSSSNTSVSK
jgi:hypothetical protein